MPVQLYASSTSVFPGETLRIHAASDQPTKYLLRIEGVTNTEKTEMMLDVRSVTPKFDPANANANDCGWDFDEIVIPADWPSGLYRAFIVADPTHQQPNLMFAVKAGPNQPRADILCSIPFTTWYAYNPWFAKSLYPYNSYGGSKCQKVSLNRPLASMNSILDIHDNEKFVEGAILAISRVPSAKYWFDIREENFVAWLSAQSELKVDYCSNIDLHQDKTILDPYQLFLSIGHDEYWSKEMRNTVERFVAHGGNAAFFAGNVSWFEITFEDADCRTMVCEKVQLPLTQKVRAGDPVSFTESNWLARPENSLSGVSFRMGAYNDTDTVNQTVGFEVLDAKHWVFKSTGLANGAVFGADAYIVGYETDAFCPPIGPRNFKTIAEARFSTENLHWNMINAESKVGRATMGVFRPIAYDDLSQSNVYTPATPGTVFTAGTTDWALGLKANLPVVTQITTNVLTTLGHKRQKKLQSHAPVYQYLPAVDLTNATNEELSFYYSSSLDGPPEYGWCSDGVAFFALSTVMAGSTPLLQYSRVDGDKWYYRYCVDHLPEGSGWKLMADTGLRVFPNGELPGTAPIFEYLSEDGLRHLYSPFKDVTWKGMTLQQPPLFWAYADLT